MIFFCVVSPQLALFGTHSPVHKHKSCLGLGSGKAMVSQGIRSILPAISTAVNRILRDRKHHDCRWYRFPRDIDSRSRLKTAVCNGRFLSCAISRCYPSKPQALWRRIQCNAAWIYPGFAPCKTTPWKCCWGMFFVWKIGMKCTDIVLTMERNLIWTDFDSWILMKMNWNPACSDIFGQGANAAFILMLNTAVLC